MWKPRSEHLNLVPTLTDAEKVSRRLYVTEYFKDFRQAKAAIRCGFAEKSSAVYASKLMKDPYVQRLIQERLQKLDEDQVITNQQVMLGLLEEATFHGKGNSHAARVTAWSKIAKIKGMEIERTRIETGPGAIAGVMIVSPVSDVGAWQIAATQAAEVQEGVSHGD